MRTQRVVINANIYLASLMSSAHVSIFTYIISLITHQSFEIVITIFILILYITKIYESSTIVFNT